MYRKGYYNNFGQGRGRRGRGGRGRRTGFGGWNQGRRGGYGPWQMVEEAPAGFGPPPWAPRWGQWEEIPEVEDASFGPPPWGMGRWMWDETDIPVADQRAWLEARKARLLAWKQHLEARLAETEAALEKLDQAGDVTEE